MRRSSKRIDGYDHVFFPCQQPRCDHGRCGERWFFAVSAEDELSALALEVITDRMPTTVRADAELRRRWPPHHRRDGKITGVVTYHAAPPLGDGSSGRCDWIDADCEGHIVGYGIADDIWAVAAIASPCDLDFGCMPDSFDQTSHEPFWLKMEEVFARIDAEERERRRPS